MIGDEQIEGHASWLDNFEAPVDTAYGVHIRVLTAGGVASLDFDFSFDGYPDVKFVPWSRVRSLRVVAEPQKQTTIANAWLETEEGNIEFAGAQSPEQFGDIVRSVRRYLL